MKLNRTAEPVQFRPIKKENTYTDRIFTTGVVEYAGLTHVADRQEGKTKGFSGVIVMAKKCEPSQEIETGIIVGGFSHNQLLALAEKVVAAVLDPHCRIFISFFVFSLFFPTLPVL